MSNPDAPVPAAPPTLSTRLREATRDAHERTENGLNLFGPDFSVGRYADLLGRWYGFESTWQRIAPVALGDTVPADFLPPRRKLEMLQADLLACGRTPAAIDALPVVPDDALPWHTPWGATGVLYVVEGSTLGGQYVARSLKDRLGFTPDHGAAYFSSYGPDVGVRWRETKRLLDAAGENGDADAVIAAANAAFTYLGQWLTSTAR